MHGIKFADRAAPACKPLPGPGLSMHYRVSARRRPHALALPSWRSPGRKEIVTGSLDKTVAHWVVEGVSGQG